MLKTTCSAVLLIAATFVLPIFAARSPRISTSFDADWRFFKGDAANAETVGFDDSAWRWLNVPHDWSIEGPFDPKNPTGGAGGFLPSGIAWYRKHFTLSKDLGDRRFFIDFEGVMENSEVWINGHFLGKRPYGYVSLSYEMTGHLNVGGDNVLAVKADTSKQPASRWYTGAGIYRHVRMTVKDPVHIPQWGAFISTPKVSESEATVNVSTEVVNKSGSSARVSVQIVLHDPKGKTVATAETEPQTLASDQMLIFKKDLTVKNPQLWHIEKGILYRAFVRVRSGGKALDEELINFGIREFHFEPATGFWLNGKNFKIKGMCLHHDGSAFGAAVPLAVWEHRLNELRKLGVNAIRNSHNPEGAFLDLADRMGFIVMDELFDQWTVAKNPYDYHLYFNEWAKTDVRDTVRRDRNHPSVMIYSAGNEIRDNHADPEKAKRTLRGLIDTFHENDPTRPVTQALFRPNIEGARDYDNGLANMLDLVGQNYREKEILAAYKQNPKRKIIGTENDRSSLDQWLAMRDHPEYSGQFIWAGIDYLGETRSWPNYAFSYGMLDRTAVKRPLGWQRQSWWSEKPMVYLARRIAPTQAAPTDPGWDPNEQRRTQVVFGDWTPADLGRHEENVEVYSNCDEVELFLNGRSLGSKTKNANDSPRNWMVPFEPGTIKAIGKNGGKVVAEYGLKTAGKPAAVKLSLNKTRVANNWDDVVFVTAIIVDENGVPVPTANDLINFEAKGSGSIVAVDSANNTDHDPFQATKRKAFQGRCLAFIKADRDTGKIMISATAADLRSNTVTIAIGR
jgi:beta-galactosidase